MPTSLRAPRDAPAGAPRRARPRALVALRWSVAALLSVCSVVFAAWLILNWGILPRIEHWRPELEARASRALGVPVRIGVIGVTPGGAGFWSRAVELREVVLGGPADTASHALPAPPSGASAVQAPGTGAAEADTGHETGPGNTLRLPKVRAVLSLASLLPGLNGRWQPRFEQLSIEATTLQLRRDADGTLHLAGLPAQGPGEGDGRAADWIFSQPDVTLRAAALGWHDAQRSGAAVRLTEVEFSVRNGVRRHVLQLDGNPPAGRSARFTVQGDFTRPLLAAGSGAEGRLLARPGDWRRWSGRVDVRLPAVDLPLLRRLGLLPAALESGRGSASARFDVRRSNVLGATVDLALQDVVLRPAPYAPPVVLAQVAGRLAGRLERGADGRVSDGELKAEQFGFTLDDGTVWPVGDLRLRWQDADGQTLAGGELHAERLDLALLQRLSAQVPAPWQDEALQARLQELEPRGAASGVALSWDGDVRAPSRYRLQARLAGLALAPGAPPAVGVGAGAGDGAEDGDVALGRPGLDGADIELQATETGGTARLALHRGGLMFPGLFEAPRIDLDRLDADLSWRIDRGERGAPARVAVRARNVHFANRDAQGAFEAAWTSTAPADAAAVASGVQSGTGTGRLGGSGPGSGPFPGTLDLRGHLDRAEATSVARYLPLHVPAGVRRYVAQALQGGQGTVDFKVRGDLRDFPFAAGRGAVAANGEFRIAARLQDVRFAYLPDTQGLHDAPVVQGKAVATAAAERPWPVFSDVRGELVFEGRSIALRGLQGRFASVGSGGLKVAGVQGGIEDWRRALLRLQGDGAGSPADALAFVTGTPIGGWLGGALDEARASAAQPPLALRLALDIPLHDDDDLPEPRQGAAVAGGPGGTPRRAAAGSATAPIAPVPSVKAPAGRDPAVKLRGRLVLAGNELRLRPDLPPLSDLRGRVDFTDTSFSLADASARLLGGEARLQGGRQADGRLRLEVQGSASAEGLRQAGDLGGWSRGAALLQGRTGYRVAVDGRDDRLDWQLSSDLVGLALDLPAPLGKTAEQALALRVRAGPAGPPSAPGAGGAVQDRLHVELGASQERVLEAHWVHERGPRGSRRVVRGGIGLFDAAPQPAEGVAASLRLSRLDVDAWEPLAGRLRDAASGAPSGAGSAEAGPAASAQAAYLPTAVALQAQVLQVGGREFHDVVAGLSRERGTAAWRANLSARELHGYVEYQPGGAAAAEGAGRVLARLTRLDLPETEADAVGSLLEQVEPERLPALDVVIDDLALRGTRLGRVEVLAHNRRQPGGAAGWQLERLRVTSPEARFEARGEWAAAARKDARRSTTLDFGLDVDDGGALLARLGQPGVVRGARGRLAGQIAWLGSPLAIDYPSLSGTLNADFDAGQFLRAEPGIAKLLGVLSLQALPRRLLLDFRDVFEQGFAFDGLNGEARIEQGVASTRNLRMRGLQAVVLMEGSADIDRETQDLRVWVVPEINAGTASLAVAVINPAVGLGSFLAQWLLRRPLALAGTREFHITGPWAEPKVERIERSEAQAPPGAEAPASAPAGVRGGPSVSP